MLETPGLEAEQVFKETQLKVAELSRGTEVPWTEDGLFDALSIYGITAQT